jgi:hypothetical protein
MRAEADPTWGKDTWLGGASLKPASIIVELIELIESSSGHVGD